MGKSFLSLGIHIRRVVTKYLFGICLMIVLTKVILLEIQIGNEK